MSLIYVLSAAALVAVSMVSWTFRTSNAPMVVRLAGPVALCSFAACTPFITAGLMGYPVPGNLKQLPLKAQLIAFAEAPDGMVDLWLQEPGSPPRAWHVEEPEGTRAELTEARKKLAQGAPVYVESQYDIKGQKFILKDSWLPRKD